MQYWLGVIPKIQMIRKNQLINNTSSSLMGVFPSNNDIKKVKNKQTKNSCNHVFDKSLRFCIYTFYFVFHMQRCTGLYDVCEYMLVYECGKPSLEV